jgi:hypothetical protein
MMRATVLIGAALLWTAAIAEAGTLATPTSTQQTGANSVACYIRNVGKKEIPLTATVKSSGIPVVLDFENCNPTPLAAGATCVVLAHNCAGCGCVVTSEKTVKNLRGTLEWRLSNSPGLRVIDSVDLQ